MADFECPACRETLVVSGIGATGKLIVHPAGEPDMQSSSLVPLPDEFVLVKKEDLRKLEEGFSTGIFQRNTDSDQEYGWAFRLVPYLSALSRLFEAGDE